MPLKVNAFFAVIFLFHFISIFFVFFVSNSLAYITAPDERRKTKISLHKKLTATELDHRLISCKKCKASGSKLCVYVVVNSLSQVIFLFLLFFGMAMHANEVETKEKQKLPEIEN